MKCPKGCAGPSRVIDSREVLAGAATRRRRQCRKCAARFTTYERRSSVSRAAAPAAVDPTEILHLRAALALATRDDLPTEAGMLKAAALARDWKQCEQIEALAIVILSSMPDAEAARRGGDA